MKEEEELYLVGERLFPCQHGQLSSIPCGLALSSLSTALCRHLPALLCPLLWLVQPSSKLLDSALSVTQLTVLFKN
jgi:hypothetical protein